MPDNEFVSDGTGYGAELTSEITTDASMSWNNKLTDYVVGTSGENVGVTPTGNEAILANVASGQTLTVNVASGASTPSVANSGLGTVDVISGQVIMTLIGHPVGATVLIYDLDSGDPQNLGTELARFNSAAASVQYQYSGGKSGDDVQVKVIEAGYRTLTEPYVLPATDNTFDTTMETETN